MGSPSGLSREALSFCSAAAISYCRSYFIAVQLFLGPAFFVHFTPPNFSILESSLELAAEQD
jgi:hypothetical protein